MDLNLSRHAKNAVLRRAAWHRANLKNHGLGIGHKHSLDEMLEAHGDHTRGFIILGLIFAGVLLAVKSLWSAVVPFELFQFWHTSGTVSEWLWSARWVFAWGFGVTTLFAFLTHDKREVSAKAESNYIQGIITSVIAGVLEEIVFRWLYFYFYIFAAVVINFILLGFMGINVIEWLTGMFFFWLMFTYGLPAAILVHFLYDFGIFTVRYVHQVIERSSEA